MSFLTKLNTPVLPNTNKSSNYEEMEYNYLLDLNSDIITKQKRERLLASYAGFCARKNYYLAQSSVEDTDNLSSKLYKNIGLAIEDTISKGLINNNKLIAFQHKLEITDQCLNIGGVIDYVYLDNANNITIGECKSVKELSSEKGKGYTVTLAHKVQSLIYSAYTGIDNVNLIVVSRKVIESFQQPVAMGIFNLDTSYEELLKVMTTAYYSQLCIDNNIIPIKDSTFRKTIECKYCPFLDICSTSEDKLEHSDILEEADELAKVFLSNRNERFNTFKKLLKQS